MALGHTLQELMENSKKTSLYCTYQTLYNSLSPEDKKALDAAWKVNMPISLIVRALRQEGHKMSNDTVRLHSKGQCKCPK
jgi:hypothetical protein